MVIRASIASLKGALLALSLLLVVTTAAEAQLNQNCTVSILNRTAQVQQDGSWSISNVPAGFGLVRARATCVQGGATQFGQSELFQIAANQITGFTANIKLGNTTPIPVALSLQLPVATLSSAGATAQLTTTASFADGGLKDVSGGSSGTQYTISNPAIATVSADGLITAVSSGTAVVQAVNEGRQAIATIQVLLAGASHGGIPDDWAIAHGLDPNDPAMPFEDPDHDGLTNLQEFQNGTDPHNPDTDGDGLTDGQEVLVYHTSPVLFSTDGTGIPDGIEVQTNTLGGSFASKLAAALRSLEVKPPSFVLNVNTIQGVASQQLAVLGHLIDGKTTLDLTSTQLGTNYSSSDLTICNFGAPDGNVFSGSNGSCVITVTNSGFTAQATAVVRTFAPTSLAFISIPGFANGVDVNGNFAFVAAGAAGLQVVNVTDRTHPILAGSLALPGNANAVKLLGNLAYVAAGSAGLHVIDVTNPSVPVLLGTLNTGGNALNVAVRGTRIYVANGSNLLLADATNPAAPTKISTLALTGTVQGVDVDTLRNLAVVAAGPGGVSTVDISTPNTPKLLGSVPTGDARQVAMRGNFVFVADFQNSTTSVDISLPSAPIVLS
ncbi:MAG TPA: Ig-like domain-containing protein, partial [Candidatus Limnocylindrales bacterium]|nr:Ig-like domain-containing protein [Candidatus Limnocylindrales bacterium]